MHLVNKGTFRRYIPLFNLVNTFSGYCVDQYTCHRLPYEKGPHCQNLGTDVILSPATKNKI